MRLALKVDVDTDRGTRIGVPQLAADCAEFGVRASFLFSLGPDQTGRAITRVFRPGFFGKVSRTSVVQIYGIRTLLNGTLLPAPHIGRRTNILALNELGKSLGGTFQTKLRIVQADDNKNLPSDFEAKIVAPL